MTEQEAHRLTVAAEHRASSAIEWLAAVLHTETVAGVGLIALALGALRWEKALGMLLPWMGVVLVLRLLRGMAERVADRRVTAMRAAVALYSDAVQANTLRRHRNRRRQP
jgi:hypothetical protein